MPTQPFHPLKIAIEGTNLIEASAGTGKTWGIAALFTRLIILEHYNVDRLLVVTFTKAATAELKNRLRSRLSGALRVLENIEKQGESVWKAVEKEDPFLHELLQLAQAKENIGRLKIRLKAAIGQFDNASIYTIHGFCQRLLRDYAFLCQAPFDIDLSENSNQLQLIAAQDFWRKRVANHPANARLVFEHKETPETMLQAMRSYLSRPYLLLNRPTTDWQQCEQQLENTWKKTSQQLDELEATFWRIHPILNGTRYHQKTFLKLFESLKNFTITDKLGKEFDKLPMLASDVLQENTKKQAEPDLAAFADLQILANLARDHAALKNAKEEALIALQIDLMNDVRKATAEQKKTHKERGFDDLLLDVHHALTASPQAAALSQTVAQNWQVALIDEFQDTDPLQYEIFQKTFIQHHNPLFLVGDPKQAIYSFRGADIHAYLQAAKDAQHHYTLNTNRRSHAKLINSISALFQQKKHPFVLPNINYADVSAYRQENQLQPEPAAIQVRWLHDKEETPNKDTLRQRAADYCANEIANMLNQAAEGHLKHKNQPLQPSHIAVLVRTHNEASLISKALKQRRVQSVLIQRESVFASAEAQALAALIGFWLKPQAVEQLRFVLTSVLFQQTAAQIHTLNQNEAELLGWIQSAEAAAERWQQHGFFAAMQAFASTHQLEAHLLAQGNERTLTNYTQLLELLADEDEQSHTPSALLQWLEAQITAATSQENTTTEANLLRLESDEELVKIVTMHASKGLQYPIVFCPFVWDGNNPFDKHKQQNWFIVHNEQNQSALLAHNQLTETHKTQILEETTSEDLRLLYVALTRAEEQLTIYAAACNQTANNPLAYLLEGTAEATLEQTREAYSDKKTVADTLHNNWQRFIQHAPQHTSFQWLTTAPIETVYQGNSRHQQQYQATHFSDRHFEFVRHTSFTGLSRHAQAHNNQHEELQPMLDPAENQVTEALSNSHKLDIHHFPRGINAGVCLHELLENLDFQRDATEQSDLILTTLTHYGIEAHWLEAVTTMLNHTRLTPIIGNQSLAQIPAKQRLPEMGFMLHMHDFNLTQLRQWFSEQTTLPSECVAAAEQLNFPNVRGFLNGFIDMTCRDSNNQVCIIDYKSNHLGNSNEHYTQSAMNEAMAEHHYYLQALIYAIATARYFQIRQIPLPQIAVRYLFLRGLNSNNNGVWQWNISSEALKPWL